MRPMIKKCLAVLLTIVTLLSQVSCGSSQSSSLTMGQWLSMIADSFGMESYTENTPYFKKVSNNDPYFGAFQAAAEWDVLPAGSDMAANTKVTWKDALVTLMNAAELTDLEASDDDKFKAAIDIFDKSIREYWGNRYIPAEKAMAYLEQAATKWATKTYDTPVEKIQLSDDVIDFFAEQVDYEYQELSQDYPMMAKDEEIVIIPINQPNCDIDFSQLKPGDVYTLPATDECSPSINKVKSVEVKDDQVIIKNDSEFTEEEALEMIEELFVQETTVPDFNKITGIYDEFGNPLEIENSTTGRIDGVLAYNRLSGKVASATNKTAGVIDEILDAAKTDITIKLSKDWKLKISPNGKGDISLEISKQLGKWENRFKERKFSAFIKTTFKDLSITKDIDYSWGTLHSATFRLDYSTTIEGGVKVDTTTEIGKHVDDYQNVAYQHLDTIISEYKSAINDIAKYNKRGVADDSIYICRITFAEFGIACADFIVKGKVTSSGEFKIVLELGGSQGIEYRKKNIRFIKEKRNTLSFVADSKLEVTVGPGVGVRVLKKINIIDLTVDCGAGVSFEGKMNLVDVQKHKLAEIQGTIDGDSANSVVMSTYKVSKEEIADFARQQGFGEADLSTMDTEVELGTGICLEWGLYPILRIGVTDGLIETICDKLSVKTTIDILGAKNIKFKGHIDIGQECGITNFSEAINTISNMNSAEDVWTALKELLGVGHECSFEFTPFSYESIIESMDAAESEEDETADNYDDIPWADKIALSESKIILKVGEKQVLELTELPKGLKTKDLKITISDYEYYDSNNKLVKVKGSDIIAFDLKKGEIKGKQPGSVMILVEADYNDTHYSAACSVWITD